MPHIEESTLTSILKEKRDQGERLGQMRRAVVVLGVIMAIQMAAIGVLYFLNHELRQDQISETSMREIVRNQMIESLEMALKKSQTKGKEVKQSVFTLCDSSGRTSIVIDADQHAISIYDEEGCLRAVLGRALLTNRTLGGLSESPEGLVIFNKRGTVIRQFP